MKPGDLEMALNSAELKAQFPILSQQINGMPLTYLDSAATSQKPQSVLDAMDSYYKTINANVHRGAHYLGEKATNAMEEARRKIQAFINADSDKEIVFTKNATEGLNLVAHCLGTRLETGDAILLTHMEHHANIVPWHILAKEKDLELRWIPITEDGLLDLSNLSQLVEGVKIVSVTAMSNVLGTITPLKLLSDAAKSQNAYMVIDACQYVPHAPTDVKEMGADFIAFSGHKMCGPTGIGVLWGKAELLEELPPYMGGGEMILNVTLDGFTPNQIPWKFEAGTPPISEAIGLGAAVDFLETLDMEEVRDHEMSLTGYALKVLNEEHPEDIKIYGPQDPSDRGGAISFNYRDIHPHDVSQVLDQEGICVRAGHHCAKPLMRELGIGATVRASLYLYNDESDVDSLSRALRKVGEFFKH